MESFKRDAGDWIAYPIRDRVWDPVRDQVWVQVWDQVWDQARIQVSAQLEEDFYGEH